MRIISKYLLVHSFTIFSIALIIIRIPPFYILQFKTPILNSYNIAGYLIAVIFLTRVYEYFLNGKKLTLYQPFFNLVALFLISQSLSILATANVTEYLIRYKNIILGIVFFILTVEEINSKERFYKILKLILCSVFINLIIEYILYFKPEHLFEFLKTILASQYLQDFEINSARGRFFIDIFDAALIPIILILLTRFKDIYKKLVLAVIMLFMIFFAFLSNFRTQTIIMFVALITGGSIFLNNIKRFLICLFLLFILLTTINLIAVSSQHSIALDRIFSPVEEDYITIFDRFYYWGKAIDMGLSSPIIGIGLGNYFDYLSKNNSLFLSTLGKDFFKITWIHPHNIFLGTFAETGLFGLITILVILILFARHDLKRFNEKNNIQIKLIISSFWLLFVFSLINPSTSLSFYGLFWLLRGLIIIREKNISN